MNYFFYCLQNYVTFSGRARRTEYWMFVLVNTIISIVIGILSKVVLVPELSTVYSIVMFLPSLAVAVRRMHDVGKSGWYCLIPIYNLILALTEGQKGENEFGTDPKAVQNQIIE